MYREFENKLKLISVLDINKERKMKKEVSVNSDDGLKGMSSRGRPFSRTSVS